MSRADLIVGLFKNIGIFVRTQSEREEEFIVFLTQKIPELWSDFEKEKNIDPYAPGGRLDKTMD